MPANCRKELTGRLTLNQVNGKYGELLIMPANCRKELTGRLTLKQVTWKIW